MDMQALMEEMGALIAKIKSGEATLGEIEAFTAAAAQLHERAIVLRYKSYEAKVYGTPVEPVQEIPSAFGERAAAPAAEPVTPDEVSEPVQPKAIYSEPDALSNPVDAEPASPETESSEEPSFDLFAEEPEEEAFDLFSLEQEDEEPSAAAEEVAMAAEIIEETEPAADMPETPLAEEAVTTPQGTWVEPVLTEDSITTIDELAAEEEPQGEVIAEELQENAPVTPQPEQSTGTPTSSEHPVYKRLVTDDNSLAARLMAIRLDTLQGAFGFNERLQIISELFGGSNEAFNQAIEQLDRLGSKSEARQVVSGIANRFAWDKDSDLALEFVQKVERRYA